MKIRCLLQAVRERRFCRFVAAWRLAICMGAVLAPPARSGDVPLLEVEARFVRATEAQVRKAFGENSARNAIGAVLTPDLTVKALRTLSLLKADFFSSPRVVAKSGMKAKVETVREMRYPTEYNPSKDEPGKSIPTAFETRDVGVSLEVEGTVQNGQIDLNIAPKIVTFLGFIDYGGHNASTLASGLHPMAKLLKRRLTEGGIWQPVFSSQQMTTSLRVKSGETILVGELPLDAASKEAVANGPRTFIFITARILPAKNTAGQSQPASP